MFLRATLWLHSHYQAEETNPRFCPNVTQIFFFFYPGLRRCKNVDLHHARTKYVANATRIRTPGCKVDTVFPRRAHGCRPISATQQWRTAKSDKIGKLVSKTSFIFADSIQAKKKKKKPGRKRQNRSKTWPKRRCMHAGRFSGQPSSR